MNHDTKRSPGLTLRLAVASAALLAAGAAEAVLVVSCVSTPAQFQAAFDSVSDGGPENGANAIINVVKGTYAVSTTLTYSNLALTGTLEIRGGYDAGCSTRSDDASLTILDGGGTTQVMNIHNPNANTIISVLTFQDGYKTTEGGGGLHINSFAQDVASVTIVNNVFRGNRSQFYAGALFATTNGIGKSVLVRGNLFVGNSATYGVGAVELIANGGEAHVYSNTITGNTTVNMDTGGLDCGGNGNCVLINNILWGNANSDLSLRSDTASLYYNDIGNLVLVGDTVPSQEIGTLSVDARFVDADSGDFHLAGDSPLLGASPYLWTTLFDLEGHPYPTAGLLDLGAYAETIFKDPFDWLE